MVKVLLDKKEEKIITAKEAYEIYLEQQKAGGPARLQLWTFNPLKKTFAFQYPTGFFCEKNAKDLMVLSVDITPLNTRRKFLDLPVFSVARVLVNLNHMNSLLVSTAIKNWQTRQCALGVVKDWKEIQYIPISKAATYKNPSDEPYKYPAKELDPKNYQVYRITYRDSSATVTEHIAVV